MLFWSQFSNMLFVYWVQHTLVCCLPYICNVLIVVDLNFVWSNAHAVFKNSEKFSTWKIFDIFGRLKSLAKSNGTICYNIQFSMNNVWDVMVGLPFFLFHMPWVQMCRQSITKWIDDQIISICFRLFFSFIRFSDNFSIVYIYVICMDQRFYAIEHRKSGHALTILTCNRNRCSL